MFRVDCQMPKISFHLEQQIIFDGADNYTIKHLRQFKYSSNGDL